MNSMHYHSKDINNLLSPLVSEDEQPPKRIVPTIIKRENVAVENKPKNEDIIYNFQLIDKEYYKDETETEKLDNVIKKFIVRCIYDTLYEKETPNYKKNLKNQSKIQNIIVEKLEEIAKEVNNLTDKK